MRALILVVLLAPVSFDLDVGVPPGTPLEWSREVRKPVPTGHRGRVPSVDERPKTPGGTVAEDRYKNVDYVVANLYDFFRVTTVDIMTHVNINLPKSTGKVSQDDVSTGGGFVMQWNYPPELPVELVWMAAMACIREQVHPEVVAWPESAAHCLELGEPSLYAAKAAQGQIGQYLTKNLKPIPNQPPVPPKSKDPKEAMTLRLAAVELTGGFPHALDPTFARRTLALGDDSYGAVLECTQNPHTFLARNAVSVLTHFPRPEVVDELKKLWKDQKDPVLRVRACLGLARRREKSIVPDLVKEVDSRDEPMQALAVHALGLIGDPAGAKPVADRAKRAGLKDADFLWTAIPALGRMGDKETLLELEKALSKKIDGNDTIKIHGDIQTPTAEEPGARFKVLRQMCAVALALLGEKKFVDEVKRRVEKSGHDGWHRATHYLLVEALAIVDGGDALLRKLIESNTGEDIIKLEALRALVRAGKADAKYLRDRALDEKVGTPSVRALSIQVLGDLDEKTAGEVCTKVIADYAAGTGDLDPAKAFITGVAAQVGGRIGALGVKDLGKSVERAFKAGAFARREGNNDPDITKAKVTLYPALLETLTIELGRTGSADALPLLKQIFEKSKVAQGRAEAVLATGAIPGKEADAVLVDALDDKDGWVRWCAYKGLARRSSLEHFCDWIFGDNEHRRKATEAYKAWLKGK